MALDTWLPKLALWRGSWAGEERQSWGAGGGQKPEKAPTAPLFGRAGLHHSGVVRPAGPKRRGDARPRGPHGKARQAQQPWVRSRTAVTLSGNCLALGGAVPPESAGSTHQNANKTWSTHMSTPRASVSPSVDEGWSTQLPRPPQTLVPTLGAGRQAGHSPAPNSSMVLRAGPRTPCRVTTVPARGTRGSGRQLRGCVPRQSTDSNAPEGKQGWGPVISPGLPASERRAGDSP